MHCQLPCLHTTLGRLICPFPEKLASHNSMQNKDDKVGNKTANKQLRKAKEKKRAREKDWNRFAKKGPNFGFCAGVKNKKAV